MILYDFGVALGFVGLIMFVTGKSIEQSIHCWQRIIRLLKKV